MQECNNELIVNDKTHAPLLLAASFQGLVKFIGSYTENGILYWRFSPKNNAQNIIDKFNTRSESRIPARDLFDAVTTFWQQVAKNRNGENRNEGKSSI